MKEAKTGKESIAINEVKTNQEVIMKEAKTGKKSIASKANYPSNRQTFICGGMKGILTFLVAFVLFGFSSCKPRENEPAPVEKVEKAGDLNKTNEASPALITSKNGKVEIRVGGGGGQGGGGVKKGEGRGKEVGDGGGGRKGGEDGDKGGDGDKGEDKDEDNKGKDEDVYA